jgi:hypothetical protein
VLSLKIGTKVSDYQMQACEALHASVDPNEGQLVFLENWANCFENSFTLL